RVGNRVRLSVPSRRGDSVFFAQLRDDFLRSGHVLSARANPFAGSIVIRHAPSFTLSAIALARFNLVCAVPPAAHEPPAPRRSPTDLKACKLTLQVLAAALGRQPALQLCEVLAEVCVEALLHRLARSQVASAVSSAS